MENISLNQTVSGSGSIGDIISFSIALPSTAKYVVELKGPTTVICGVYEGSITPGNGKLRVCGAAVKGTRTLNATNHTITIELKSSGVYGLLVRPWKFTDYFSSFKSTC